MPAYCHQILIHFKPDIIIENVKLLNLHILHLRKKKKRDQSHIMYPTMLTPSKKTRLPRGYVLQIGTIVYYKEPEIRACVCSALNRILTGTAKVHS